MRPELVAGRWFRQAQPTSLHFIEKIPMAKEKTRVRLSWRVPLSSQSSHEFPHIRPQAQVKETGLLRQLAQ